MKKALKAFALAVALAVAAFSFQGSAAAAPKLTSLIIATATTGGTYYPVGVAMATLWTTKLRKQGIRVSPMSTAGSGENIPMLKGKEVELAILQGLFGSMAFGGTGIYKGKPYKELRTITMLWPNTEHFVLVKKKVKTGTVVDIKGTRFSIGRAGSGTERSGLFIMKGIGLTVKDVKPEYLGYFESASAMKDGKIDGANLVAGEPVAAVTDLFSAPGMDVVILEFTDEQIKSIVEKTPYPGFRYIIPANTYRGQTKPIRTMAQPNFLGVRADVDEGVVYLLTKTIFENLGYLVKAHKATRFIKLESALSGLPGPLHPGALKYYRERGLKIPERLIPPEAK